jgi:hypothetical protein
MYDLPFDLMVRRAAADISSAVAPAPVPPPAAGAPPAAPPGMPPGAPPGMPPGAPQAAPPGMPPGMPPQITAMLQARQGQQPQPAMLPRGGLPPQIMAMLQARQAGAKAAEPQRFAAGGGVWTRKEGQNPEGGLNAKGRASLKAQGQDIKPPVSAKMAAKSPKAAGRRKSFCARMTGMPGPMKDEQGRPTRKALSLRKWDC